MKKTAITIFILMLFKQTLFAQAPWICTVAPDPPPSQSPPVSQPTNCNQLLVDLEPTSSNERTIEVNVHVKVFAPTNASSLTSAWIHTLDPTTQSDVQTFLDVANATFTNIPAIPQLTVPSNPINFTNARIKLVLKTFTIVNHDAGYANVKYLADGDYGLAYHDPNAINVFLGTFGPTILQNNNAGAYPQPPGEYPNNWLYFTPIAGSATLTPELHDNIRGHGKILAHEVCHILGLNHSRGVTTSVVNNSLCCRPEPTFISPTYGCCSYVEPIDYFMESYPCSAPDPPSCTLLTPFQNCNTPGGSDNLMSQNAACNRYLSPQQAGVIHYNLRTVLKSFLSASGYTAATERNPAFDYYVTSNETWEGGDRYFKGHVIVNPNKTLVIKCGVAMTKDAGIYVLPGGQLVVDGGTVTSISGRMWNGIYVVGQPTLPRLVPNSLNPGAVEHQGLIRIKNGGTISNAIVGIRNHLNHAKNAGGIIFAQNSNFVNNKVDVDYDGLIHLGIVPPPDPSWFSGCNFITNGFLVDNSSPMPDVHMILRNVKGITIRACIFENTFGTGGIGIRSTNSSYVVDQLGTTPCVFKALQRGVFINNTNSLLAPQINNSVFDENTSFGIYALNANYLSVQNNTVILPPAPQNPVGIYLNKCKYYKIRSNRIEQSGNNFMKPGLSIFDSGEGAHEIYRNTFVGLGMGVNCMDRNRGTGINSPGAKMNCNVFNESTFNNYDIAMTHTGSLNPPTVAREQGNVSSPSSDNVVRNIYGSNSLGSNCTNYKKWYIHSSSTDGIDHGANTNTFSAVTQPMPQPLCSSSLLSIVDASISLDFPVHCPTNPQSSGGGSTVQSQRLANMNEYISELKADNGENQHHYEIQSTVASKISLFLADTVNYNAGLDSVIAILEGNHGDMEDSDIQLIYAWMLKGDYSEAMAKVNDLGAGRADWQEILTKLIELEQDTVEGIYGANTQDNIDFFSDYIAEKKDGYGIAETILYVATDSIFTEPHAVPDGEEGARAAQSTNLLQQTDDALIKLYPNPAQTGFYLSYGLQNAQILFIEMKDLLGKKVYTARSKSGENELYIPVENLSNGMYLISVTKNEQVIYKAKVVKQN